MGSKRGSLALTAVALAGLMTLGCDRDDSEFGPPVLNNDPTVTFANAEFQPWIGSAIFDEDGNFVLAPARRMTYSGDPGAEAFRFAVLDPSDGPYTGGAIVSLGARDLTQYNALRVYVRAEAPTLIGPFGINDDNTGTARYTASIPSVNVTTEWREVLVPIPNPSRLVAESGLAWFALPNVGAGVQAPNRIWMDEMEFVYVPGLDPVAPGAPISRNTSFFRGVTVDLPGQTFSYSIRGATVNVDVSAASLDFVVEPAGVVEIVDDRMRGIGAGTATVTAKLGDVPANVTLAVTVLGAPEAGPDRPEIPAADVVALFSNAYDEVPVRTWATEFSGPQVNVSELRLGGDDVLAYSGVGFTDATGAIAELTGTLDLTDHDFLSFDVWLSGSPDDKWLMSVELLDLGENGVFDEDESDLRDSAGRVGLGVLNGSTLQGFAANQWHTIRVPLDQFRDGPTITAARMTQGRANFKQITFRAQTGAFFVDNVYFYASPEK